MVRIVTMPKSAEAAALLRETARLAELGDAAAEQERVVVRLRWIRLLERVAAHPPGGDETQRRENGVRATREAQALRDGAPPLWGGW
jgi:hypothetical protein